MNFEHLIAACLAGALVVAATTADAASCRRLAENCMKNGGTKDRCFAPAVLAHCKKTCEMIGPYTGKVFVATTGCIGKR